MLTSHDVIVIGAGPAGLATSRELGRAGIDHVVLERGEKIGHTWANLYDGLVLHTGKHFSALPGLAFPASTPLFPSRRDFLDYLYRYAEVFRIPVETGTDVADINRVADGWTIRTATGRDARARVVVVATGIVSNPNVPSIANRGRFRGHVIHSVDYRRPDVFQRRRVLVVGAGNSAAEISVELARAGAHVTVAVRSGGRVLPRALFGIPIQYFAVAMSLIRVRPSRRCPDPPLIGLRFASAVRDGSIRLKGAVREFTMEGVRFSDGSDEPFDHVILATGYKAALGMLGDRIQVDDCGFAARQGRERRSAGSLLRGTQLRRAGRASKHRARCQACYQDDRPGPRQLT